MGPIKAHCSTLSLQSLRTPKKPEEEQAQDCLDICARFDFDFTKEKLLDHLKERINTPGTKSEIPSTWELYRAYGQMKLALAAKAEQIEIEELDGKEKDKRKAGHLKVLKKIVGKVAREKAETMSGGEEEKIFKNYVLEYRAGQKWLEVVKWFGGQGAVFVVLTVGTRSGNLTLLELTAACFRDHKYRSH